MKYGFTIFWMLYALFFAIPFPMLLYYGIKSENPLNIGASDPWLSLGIVVLSVIFWIIVLVDYYRKWVVSIFLSKRNIERLKKNGVYREAQILESINLSTPNVGYNTYELILELENLVGSEITQKADVNDVRPNEHRFETGKKVGLLIDKEIKNIPYFIFEGSEADINKGIVLLINLGWMLLSALVIGYYIYSYQTESEDMGWRFISFGHPLLICPAVLLFYRFLFSFLGGKLRGVPGNAALIKFKGIKTTAKLLASNLTGTFINAEPMVNFELEFIDHQNYTHRASIKKIVGLLELDSTRDKTVDIFYLKEDPQSIAFASDLNKIS